MSPTIRTLRAIAAIAVSAIWATAAAGASSDWARETPLDARLITATDAVAPGSARVSAGLHVRLAEGWKIYWRSPGEVGLPPSLDWSGSDNIADARIAWPAPTRFDAFGIENFGYAEEVVLPLEIALAQAGGAARLAPVVDLLACEQICVPLQLTPTLDLPVGAPTLDADSAALIARFAARVPDDGAASGLTLRSAALDGDAITVAVQAATPVTAPDVFLELDGAAAFGRPDIRLSDDGLTIWARTPLTGGAAHLGQSLRVTVADGARAATLSAPLDAAPAAPPHGGAASGRDALGLALTLATALLGGLILNAMPCVLPVLSLKIGGAMQARAQGDARARAGFVATAAGVVVSMWVVAAGVLAAQGLGLAVGWGLQFQSPVFLAFMTAVAALFAANMAGLFEIALPGAVADRAAAAGGRAGLAGDFATGAFATLMATPCSAPFVGAAVAYALTGGASDVALIFTALGLGLATPYIALAVWPGAVRALPRPGPWMATVKLVLAALLAATAVWLLSVLASVGGAPAAVVTTLALAGALGLIALRGRAEAVMGRRGAGLGAAACVVLALAGPLALRPAPVATQTADAAQWAAFDRGAIARLVSQGQVVFVDVTADWCLTCKANKALVLDGDPVAGLLASTAVTPMRADWTRPDPAIARYLADFDRFGIPFNAVYGPGAPAGLPLPELLTDAAVLTALETAAGQPLAALR